jgi:hypothetical protein
VDLAHYVRKIHTPLTKLWTWQASEVTTEDSEQTLAGGSQTDVTRERDVVRRSPKPQSATVMALLDHLSQVGFDAAPRPVGSGFSPDGREQLAYIEGESPQPGPWSDDAAHKIGQILRALHKATATFSVPDDAVWVPWFARLMSTERIVIGHGDLGPWNILAVEDRPVAFIDWDNAGPVDARVELAHVAWLNAQLHDDDVGALNNLASPEDRVRQLGLIVDAYGLEGSERDGFVDVMIELALRSARQEAVDADVGPDSSSPGEDGFPLLWAVTWRTRAAVWMLDHRSLLQRALT